MIYPGLDGLGGLEMDRSWETSQSTDKTFLRLSRDLSTRDQLTNEPNSSLVKGEYDRRSFPWDHVLY